jgi:nucleoside-diphosphate-sugar epimerase
MAVYEVTAVFHLAASDPSALLQAVNRYSRRVPVVTARPIPHLAIARTEDPHEERLSVVRFGEVFGPGNRKHFREESAPPTDGPARDFVFIRDAAHACLLAAETAANIGPGNYAFRSGWLLTDRQMAAAIRDVSASRTVEVPDSAPLVNPLGWQPAQSLTEALSETLAWYRANLPDSLRAAA